MNMEKEENYKLLREAAEAVVGCEMRSLSDFSQLQESIQVSTGKRLSTTTLRRFWGYQEVEKSSRVSLPTLNILAHFVGYTDFASFCSGVSTGSSSQSGMIARKRLFAVELHVGDTVIVTWNPGRRLCLRYLGSSQFLVEEAISSKLQVGDTFTCHVFLENEPLYLNNIVRCDTTYPSFVCGRQDGILFNKA